MRVFSSEDASALLAIIMLAVFVIALPVLDAVSQRSGCWVGSQTSCQAGVSGPYVFHFALGGAREWRKD